MQIRPCRVGQSQAFVALHVVAQDDTNNYLLKTTTGTSWQKLKQIGLTRGLTVASIYAASAPAQVINKIQYIHDINSVDNGEYMSEDNGNTWKEVSTDPSGDTNAIFYQECLASKIIPTKGAVRVTGHTTSPKIRFYYSKDGKDWSLTNTSTLTGSAGSPKLYYLGKGVYAFIMARVGGNITVSYDYGQTWVTMGSVALITTSSTGRNADVNLKDGTIMIHGAGSNATCLISKDQGITWIAGASSGPGHQFNFPCIQDNDNWIASSAALPGTLISTNQGHSWTFYDNTVDGDLLDRVIKCKTAGHYVAQGNGNAADTIGIGLFKTKDGGVTWEEKYRCLDAISPIRFLRLCDSVDGKLFIAILKNSSFVYVSTDEGENWKKHDIGVTIDNYPFPIYKLES